MSSDIRTVYSDDDDDVKSTLHIENTGIFVQTLQTPLTLQSEPETDPEFLGKQGISFSEHVWVSQNLLCSHMLLQPMINLQDRQAE